MKRTTTIALAGVVAVGAAAAVQATTAAASGTTTSAASQTAATASTGDLLVTINANLYLFAADGTNKRPLTNTGGIADASFSPDG
ncbi:MAG: hypothetical protein V9G19_03550 [Tetrasphaera sp.]